MGLLSISGTRMESTLYIHMSLDPRVVRVSCMASRRQ